MEYKGLKVTEAYGKNYPPSTPKPMLVWDNGTRPSVREVIGFINGRWAAVDYGDGCGTCNWDHAAEIPKKPTLAGYCKGIEDTTGNCLKYNALKCEDCPRTNYDMVCELAQERRGVSILLARLNKAIESDPEVVSEHHKELWRKQAKAMKEYADVLGERIKDMIDNG